jgi:hypothetical protein
MRADSLNLKAIFQREVRYVIPTFQRPYVWSQEKQWEPLWNDVRNAAERYLDGLAEIGGDPRAPENRAKAEELAGSHFMGAVVFQQRFSATADLDTRDVIDGQQRLTTMQLLTDAARQVLAESGHTPEAKLLQRLVRNPYAEGDHEFKLWPTQLDQAAFRAAMRGADDVAEFEDSPIVQTHAFFRLQIREWLAASDEDERALLAHALQTVIYALLQHVVIDLSAADDAAVIFETLNARGTPLLASDLVKNYVLQAARAEALDSEALHRNHWSRLEDSWWREEVRQGRIVRPRLDSFLGYWLTMRTASEVQSHDVFPRFRKYREKDGNGQPIPVTDVVVDVVRVASLFRALEENNVSPDVQRFLYRWRVVDAGVVTPVLLWLFSAEPDVLTQEARSRCLTALESFLVRRMICRRTTKDYNRLFIELLGKLQSATTDIDDVLVGYLAGQESDSRQWPDNTQLTDAFTELPLYRLLTRGRLRMVLEAIEESLRSPYTETLNVPTGVLTIEHIMPRSWEKHWSLAQEEDPAEARAQRERLVHSVGNLTLITGKLNTAQSNGSWEAKRKALSDHSVLYLNKQLIDSYGESTWDEKGIRGRGRALAAKAATIWPSAAELTRSTPTS